MKNAVFNKIVTMEVGSVTKRQKIYYVIHMYEYGRQFTQNDVHS